MNVWQFLWQVLQCAGQRWNVLVNFLWYNKLKMLSAVQIAVGTIAASTGLIPASHLPAWLVANGILTGWMALANPNRVDKPDITLPKPKEITP